MPPADAPIPATRNCSGWFGRGDPVPFASDISTTLTSTLHQPRKGARPGSYLSMTRRTWLRNSALRQSLNKMIRRRRALKRYYPRIAAELLKNRCPQMRGCLCHASGLTPMGCPTSQRDLAGGNGKAGFCTHAQRRGSESQKELNDEPELRAGDLMIREDSITRGRCEKTASLEVVILQAASDVTRIRARECTDPRTTSYL
jgi:hypothetical protein